MEDDVGGLFLQVLLVALGGGDDCLDGLFTELLGAFFRSALEQLCGIGFALVFADAALDGPREAGKDIGHLHLQPDWNA